MPSIALSDKFGLDVNAELAPGSALLKYVRQIPSLHLDNLDLKKIGGLTLDEPAVLLLTTGVSFQQPVDLGDGTFTVGAGVHGSIEVIDDADDLPAHDGTLKMPPDDCYFSFGIDAEVSAGVSVPVGNLQFGASPSTTVQIKNYSRFRLKSGVTLLDALTQTVAGFVLPLHCEDLEILAPGQLTRAAVTGKLRLSGGADLFAITNPLASATLGAAGPAVNVTAGGSATVGISCEIESKYEIAVRRLENGLVRLAWYHENATEIAVNASVSEGVSAGFGSGDLLSLIVRLVSGNPRADLQELESAGLPKAQAKAIRDAVKAAASRKLEIALSGEIWKTQARAATFLYEIAPDALTEDSKKAVDQALRGDLSALHAGTLPGITCVNSIWENIRKHGFEWNINLLGILNYRSITKLALAGEVLYEPATGALVITDKATAQRIRSTQVNYGADTQKLRHVLAESFLITAAYHAAKVVEGNSLHCSHSFFELQNTTNRSDLARQLETGVALGLLSASEAQLPAEAQDFGRSLFFVSTDYDDELTNALFLDTSGAPLPRTVYENAGREAIQFLVQPGDDDAVRREPAIDNDLWRRMAMAGQPGFPALFPGVPAPLVGAITADYSTIQWWADAMRGTAEQLAKTRMWLQQHPGTSPDDPEFARVRSELASHLSSVAATTREEFGEPWGLIAMSLLSGRRAGAKLQISGPKLAIEKRRELAAVTEL
jgi:hypothetical protein